MDFIPSPPSQPTEENAWRQFDYAYKTYEYYWGVSLKISAYFYTLAGATGAFYIANRTILNLQWVLLIPFYLGVALCILYSLAALWSFSKMQDWFDDLADNTPLQMNYRKDSDALSLFLGVNAGGFILVAGLAWMMLTTTTPAQSQKDTPTQRPNQHKTTTNSSSSNNRGPFHKENLKL